MTYIAYGGAGFDSTPIAPNSFTFTKTISANSLNTEYDVATDATANGWDGIKPVLATITVSAKLKGANRTSADTYAFDTGVLPTGSSVDVIVTSSGIIWGGGGSGGAGDGNVGVQGGTAMNFRVNGSVTIQSGGEVGAGSGGGGGGASRIINEITTSSSGGGGGWPNGAGGAAGETPGTAGAAGTESGGGAGGTSGADGGNGGNKNASATAGEAVQGISGAGGDGGAQGVGIKKNGNTVSVNNSGTLFGNPAQQA